MDSKHSEKVYGLVVLNHRRKSIFIAGTALLGSVVVVLDWMSKTAGLKIPFVPPLGFLKFDAIGIPMLLSYFLFGFLSGTITSLVGWFSISYRDPFSGFMKFLAEFSTIIGVFLVLRVRSPNTGWWKGFAMFSGILARVVIMATANIALLPIFYPTTPIDFVLAWLPLISLFNILQGAVSVLGGFVIYEAIIVRLPSLKSD